MKRGFILPMTVAAAALLLLVGFALVDFLAGMGSLSARHERSRQAREAASAGLDRALAALRRDAGWTAGFAPTRLAGSGATYGVSFPDSTHNGDGPEPAAGFQGRVVPQGMVHLVSRGASGPAQVLQQAMVDPGRVLLRSTFDADAAGWTQARGMFSVLLGRYVVGSQLAVLDPQEQRTFAGDAAWTDYEVEAVFTVSGGSGFGIFVRAADTAPAGAYLFRYDAATEPQRGGAFTLHPVVNGVVGPAVALTYRDETPFAGLAGWLLDLQHTFAVRVQGGEITATVDGAEVLRHADRDNPFPAGMVGLQGPTDTVALVDSVTVRSAFAVRARW